MDYLMFGRIRDQDIVEIENCLLDLDGVVEGLLLDVIKEKLLVELVHIDDLRVSQSLVALCVVRYSQTLCQRIAFCQCGQIENVQRRRR